MSIVLIDLVLAGDNAVVIAMAVKNLPDKTDIKGERTAQRLKSGSRKPRATHVRLDSNACIGCVACTRCENFEMGQDMKAHVVKAEVKDEKCVLDAVANCPVGALDLLPLSELDD